MSKIVINVIPAGSENTRAQSTEFYKHNGISPAASLFATNLW